MHKMARRNISDSKVKKAERRSFQTEAAPKNPVWLTDEKIMQLVSKKKLLEEDEKRF